MKLLLISYVSFCVFFILSVVLESTALFIITSAVFCTVPGYLYSFSIEGHTLATLAGLRTIEDFRFARIIGIIGVGSLLLVIVWLSLVIFTSMTWTTAFAILDIATLVMYLPINLWFRKVLLKDTSCLEGTAC